MHNHIFNGVQESSQPIAIIIVLMHCLYRYPKACIQIVWTSNDWNLHIMCLTPVNIIIFIIVKTPTRG